MSLVILGDEHPANISQEMSRHLELGRVSHLTRWPVPDTVPAMPLYTCHLTGGRGHVMLARSSPLEAP